MPRYAVSQLKDEGQIRDYLTSDIGYAAYALGDLEPPYSDHTTWLAASQSGSIDGLALIYEGLEPTVLFLMGDAPALSALLLYGIGPDKVFFTAKPEMQEALASFYRLEEVNAMFRMRVTSGIFRPTEDTSTPPTPITPLNMSHVTDLLRLIEEAAAADGRDLGDVAFTPEMVKDGTYRGIYLDGRLAAAAGTHIVARQASMAAIGNVVVHPDMRRRGLGSRISQAVTQALIQEGFELIVLNVRQNNQPANKIYHKLGYRQVGTFIEGLAERR